MSFDALNEFAKNVRFGKLEKMEFFVLTEKTFFQNIFFKGKP